jgi:peptidoglycan hydrolase-like protein with peptidoglycan-binding domain
MFLAVKAAYAGIVFLLLTTWISGPRPNHLTVAPDLGKEVLAGPHPNDVNKMQQTLQNQGHYRGKVDGVVGLRTRASIRAYQKAEHLPVTGRLDNQTAAKLGLTPEGHADAGHETTGAKPSAGIERAKGSRRSGKTGPNTVKTDSHIETGQGVNERKPEAETPHN